MPTSLRRISSSSSKMSDFIQVGHDKQRHLVGCVVFKCTYRKRLTLLKNQTTVATVHQNRQKRQTFKKACCLMVVHFDPVKFPQPTVFILHHILFDLVREIRGRVPGHSEVLTAQFKLNVWKVCLFILTEEKIYYC